MTRDLARDQEQAEAFLLQNRALSELLVRLDRSGFEGFYLGAGCIAQTVWNGQSAQAIDAHIVDYDVVYFDPERADETSERRVRHELNELAGDLGIVLDVCNQARVHTWYEAEFGRAIRPFASVLDAIETWPTTSTAIGVRREGTLRWLAPFGLGDLLDGIVRPNKALVTRDDYERKVARWQACWPHLHVVRW